MARKLRGNTTMDMVNTGISQRNKPIVLKNSTETYSTNNSSQPSIGDSYNKMVGQYDPDISKFTGMLPSTNQFTQQPMANGFYGSMSGLEGASMRLANAASQRSMAEAGYGSTLKRVETANEYGLRDTSTAKEYGLKGGLLGQEYGLRGNLAQRESDISSSLAARLGGYSSVQNMSSSIANDRRERERKEKEAEDTAKRLAKGQYQVGGRWMLGPGQR
jgi:hypothetical protein